MGEGIRVGSVGDIEDGEAFRVETDVTGADDAIAIFNDGGAYYALNDTCPHEVASLSDGWIEDGVVECPLHAARFCLRSGAVLSMPATEDVAAHRLEVQDDDIILYPGEPVPPSAS
jgi:3-phenylpropionate/trans-cinnamate dioxygenase ferredoxin subunit